MPIGGRKEITRRARELVEIAGAEVDEYIAGDKDFIRRFCESLKEGAEAKGRDRDRTCVNAVLDILKRRGQERLLVIEWARQMGAKDDQEVRDAVRLKRSADDANMDSAAQGCMAYVVEVWHLLPRNVKDAFVRALGAYLPVDSSRVGTE